MSGSTLIAAGDYERLKWRSRRGLLENDLVLQTYFERHGATLTVDEAAALNEVLALIDGDLWDILVGRKTLLEIAPASSAAAQEIIRVLRAC